MPTKTRKVAVMGYRSVGKSSLCIQFVEGHFVDSYDPTIENTFNKTIKVKGQEYTLDLVDTAGQDEFSLFPAHYSMDVNGYVLVYSITSVKSFKVVQRVYEKILDNRGNVNVPIVLVGNKTDLHMDRTVPTDEGRKKAEEWKAVFLETTAKQHDVLGCFFLLSPIKAVNEIFSKVILEIEKADGNYKQDSNCTVS